MSSKITFIYAFRDRDEKRVQRSLESLQRQHSANFEVVFVDYGSQVSFADAVERVVNSFSFASYHYIAHPGLLWNKSKAINYGIKKAVSEYIFIADVDIIFHPETTTLFEQIATPEKAYLFKLGYISEDASAKLNETASFEAIPLKHSGDINGMILASKSAFEKVHGMDEFFHFYGSEDVDVFQRLEFSGLELTSREEPYFKHIWHRIYNSYNDAEISIVPRIFNIKRINLEHYRYHQNHKISIPVLQKEWGKVVKSSEREVLEKPSVEINLDTNHAKVIHFFEVQLRNFPKHTIKIMVSEAKSDTKLKSKVKKILKKNTETYLSIKEVNDIILTKIITNYRDYNYSYKISSDLKSLEFVIQL